MEDYPYTRDSDKQLIWEVWVKLSLISNDCINYLSFVKAPSTETIRRCRQKIQELHPELRGSKRVREMRKDIADQKGTHIFRSITGEQNTLI